MAYKFEQLEVWQLAMEYTDLVYNIAEGSTRQSNPEQARFLGLAVRSLIETVACQHLINRRQYLKDPEPLRNAYRASEKLFAKLQAFRHALIKNKSLPSIREETKPYLFDDDDYAPED
ncbi:MAG: four helix bundle protein [Anaerolineales bacterium]|nr:four helix bundle protein [Anaerolineales bacterium]